MHRDDHAAPDSNAGTVLTENNKSFGFDPLGILQRAHEEAQRVRGVTRQLLYIANGQGDVGNGAAQHQAALTSVGSFFLARGYEVTFGFTGFSPATTGTIADWTAVQTGWSNALTALQAASPGRVRAGANLFAAMGTTGPMGGAKITGSVSGKSLTVSAVAQGAIEIGHNVWNGATLTGVVTGRSGSSWTLSGAVATASASLIVAGAFLQYDGVHLDGAGAVGPAIGGVNCAGTYLADAIKTAVPRVPR